MTKERVPPRRYCKVYLQTSDNMTGKFIGHLVNLTTRGLMLISEEPLDTGLLYNLKIDFPTEVAGVKNVVVEATGRWCKEDANPGFYNTGFELENTSSENIQLIESVIDTFCFLDNQ